ncbi:MAG: hypothetical protein NVV82_15375 [Sporocytophaga sp.]|nr:hypothetical protein [Sporocytophaga sp.]
MTIFLQVADSALAVASAAGSNAKEGISYLQLIMMGGLIMVPILLLSLISFYIFIERYLYIRNNAQPDKGLLSIVKEKVQTGKTSEALRLCENSSLPVARMLEKAIIRLGSSIRDIESAMENVAAVEVSKNGKEHGITCRYCCRSSYAWFPWYCIRYDPYISGYCCK